jgi:hypothetical protein
VCFVCGAAKAVIVERWSPLILLWSPFCHYSSLWVIWILAWSRQFWANCSPVFPIEIIYSVQLSPPPPHHHQLRTALEVYCFNSNAPLIALYGPTSQWSARLNTTSATPPPDICDVLYTFPAYEHQLHEENHHSLQECSIWSVIVRCSQCCFKHCV